MNLQLNPTFEKLWQNKEPFTEVDRLQGKVYRELEGRRTLRFEVDGQGYFLKSHKGIGWKEIIKNLLQLRYPILGATHEKRAIAALQTAGIGTMTMAAFGCRGTNPAQQESFIITEAIEPSISLEDLAIEWRQHPPSIEEKRRLLMEVCEITRRMHAAGVNHRDFYICHFLLPLEGDDCSLMLIDLHRALIHSDLPFRWRLKDLASLYYSAFDVPLTKRDKLRFIKHYSGLSLRQTLQQDRALWHKVEKKAKKLYEKALRKGIVR